MDPTVLACLLAQLVVGATGGIGDLPFPLAKARISTFDLYMVSSAQQVKTALQLAELYGRIGRLPAMLADDHPGSVETPVRVLYPLQDDDPALIIGSMTDFDTLMPFFATPVTRG
jgi:hypothetical protein